MAEITFPNAPTLNEVYEAENGIKYQWDGEKWSTLPDSEGQIPSGGDPGQFLAKASVADYDLEWVDAAPPTTIGTSPPTEDLEEGQLWWRSDTGVLYIYYVDENSSQWVQAAVGTDTRVQAQIYTGDVPPIGPGEGDLWWNTTDTNLYIYYQGYWVQSTSSDGAGGGGGDVEEAPIDGQAYARKDGDWSVVNGGESGARYQQGTWTPFFSDQQADPGTSVTTTAQSTSATWTRIGNQVTISGYIILESKGNLTGNVAFSGVPVSYTHLRAHETV